VDELTVSKYVRKVRTINERDGNNTPTVSYTRLPHHSEATAGGNDLSGSMEGAGGIGGLLARSSGYSGGNWTSHAYYFADGNGNVTYMLNSSQAMVASYRYDPFGNTISSSGTLASANVYRFSSKEIHANSGMYYYGKRFYDPNLQRWINRDPIEERGGINLYGFAGNDPENLVDADGLGWWPPSKWPAFRTGPPPPPSITPCTPAEAPICLAICMAQNKMMNVCNIVKTTKTYPFGWWVQSSIMSCLCTTTPVCPLFK
jgi:RHS repeat-associated protein